MSIMRASVLIALLALPTATAQSQSTTISTSSLSPLIASCPVLSSYPSSTTNLYPVHAVPVITSDLFTIQYTNTQKLVTNTQTGEQYILNLSGAPSASVTNSTFNVGIGSNARTFTIPFNKVCVAETPVETYLELLGVRSSIAYDVLSLTTSSCIELAGEKGLIQPYVNSTQDGFCEGVWGNVDTYDASAGGDAQVISFSVDLESTMLGRAEWIKFVSAFYNKEAAAIAIFNGIVSRYNSLKSAAASAASSGSRPVVAWMSYNAAYSASPATYTLSTLPLDAYKANLTGDAAAVFWNGTTDYPAGGYSNAIDLFNDLQSGNVTILIDETYQYIYNANGTASVAFNDLNSWLTYLNVTQKQATQYSFLQNIWRDDKSQTASNLQAGLPGQDDWFESAYPNADAVLADFVTITQPSAALPNYRAIWFRSLNNGTPVTIIGSCNSTDLSLPRSPTLAGETDNEFESVTCPTFLTQPQSLNAQSVPSTATTVSMTTISILSVASLIFIL